jgi:hypothetical protein
VTDYYTSQPGSVLKFNDLEHSWLTFNPCGVRVNLKTGEVVIPEGITLDEASRAFWEGLSHFYGVKG